MAVGINFGNFDVIGGKTVGSGMSSGLNTKQIVDGLVDAKKIPITKLEDKVKLNSEKVAAYSELEALMMNLKKCSTKFRASPHFGDSSQDIFKKRQVFVSSNTSTPANVYIGVAAKEGAEIRKYDLKVTSLAQAKTQISNSFSSKTASVTTASTTAGSFKAGTFKINDMNITLQTGDSLVDIMTKINAVTADTGVTANVVKVSSTDYRFFLKAKESGSEGAYTITDTDGVLSPVTFTVTAAVDAAMEFDGIPITRTSNVIDDIVDNVTFSLYQQTPVGTTLNAEIAPDSASVIESVKRIVGCYNALKTFHAKHNQKDPMTGDYKEGAYLAGDNLLGQIATMIYEEMSQTVAGIEEDCAKLTDIGINYDDYDGDDETPSVKNILVVNELVLQNKLEKEFDAVRQLFEFNMTANSNKIMVSSRSNKITAYDFSLDIDTARAAGDEVRLTYDDNGTPKTINAKYTAADTGGKIEGIAGTAIEGLSFYYAGGGTDVIDVKITQGIGDKLFNFIEMMCSGDDSPMATAKKSFIDNSETSKTEIAKLSSEVDKYRERMLEQYSAVETAISKVNSVMQYLDAVEKARNSNSR